MELLFDLHADQIQGFFEIPITHIEGKNVFVDDISLIHTQDMVLCGPDAGSGKRVKRMQKQLQNRHNLSVNYVMMDKTRSKANEIDEMVIIGNVEGKDVVSLLQEALKRKGVRKAYIELQPELQIIKKLAHSRAEKGISQRVLAEKIGVTQSALARFETGQINPTLSFLQKVTSGLGLKILVK